MLFRETPAEHPKDNNGQQCSEMRGYSYQPWNGQLAVDPAARITVSGWQSGANLNTAARAILTKHNLPVIAAFNISVPLADNHIERNMNPELDCLHYCSPGVPEVMGCYFPGGGSVITCYMLGTSSAFITLKCKGSAD